MELNTRIKGRHEEEKEGKQVRKGKRNAEKRKREKAKTGNENSPSLKTISSLQPLFREPQLKDLQIQ